MFCFSQIEQCIAEIAVIAGGILQADDRAFIGKRYHGLACKLGMDADRDVVGNQRNIDRIAHHAEMIDDLGLAGDCIERSRDDDRIGANVLCGFCMGNHAVGRRVYDTGNDRNTAIRHFHRMFKNPAPVCLVIEHHLAGGTEGKKRPWQPPSIRCSRTRV